MVEWMKVEEWGDKRQRDARAMALWALGVSLMAKGDPHSTFATPRRATTPYGRVYLFSIIFWCSYCEARSIRRKTMN